MEPISVLKSMHWILRMSWLDAHILVLLLKPSIERDPTMEFNMCSHVKVECHYRLHILLQTEAEKLDSCLTLCAGS